MTHHRLPYSTVSGTLCTAVAAAFLASAPISSAAAAGSNAATGGLTDLPAQCDTVIAQPGFASGAVMAACQGYDASYVYGMNGGERGPAPYADSEYPYGPNPNGMYGSSRG